MADSRDWFSRIKAIWTFAGIGAVASERDLREAGPVFLATVILPVRSWVMSR